MLWAILLASVGMLKETITALAMGMFVIVLTIKNERINRKLSLILLTVFYTVPMITWFIFSYILKDKAENQEIGLGYVSIMVFLLLLQIFVGYFIAELIFKKKIFQSNEKPGESKEDVTT
jgi:Na+-transporting NADH:ubiquinone oxidoreductase subunit NqrE